MFFSLVLKAMEDPDTECRDLANKAIKVLLESLSGETWEKVIKSILSKDRSDSPDLVWLVLLLSGLVLKVEGEWFGWYFDLSYAALEETLWNESYWLEQMYEESKQDKRMSETVVKKTEDALGHDFLQDIGLIDEDTMNKRPKYDISD